MNIIYKYIDVKDSLFYKASSLRFDILFKPYNKINKYLYDDLDNKSMHLIALDNNDVIGYSRLTLKDDIGKITNVSVNPQYKNIGVGSRMIKYHICMAKSLNIDSLYLNARINTVDFYKKAGFKCDSEILVSDKTGLVLQKMILNLNNLVTSSTNQIYNECL